MTESQVLVRRIKKSYRRITLGKYVEEERLRISRLLSRLDSVDKKALASLGSWRGWLEESEVAS